MLTDITDMNDQDLTDSMTTVHQSLTRHKARFLLMVGVFHLRSLARAHGAPNTATWLIRTHDLSRRSAFEYIGVGTRLHAFPLLASAFLAGDLSYSKIRVLLRYMSEGNQEELVDLATRHTLTELEQLLTGRDRVTRRKATNSLSIVDDADTGGIRFWGRLDPERAAEFLAALKVGELGNLRDLSDLGEEVLRDPAALDALLDRARGPEPAEGQSPLKVVTRFGAPMVGGLLSALFGMIHMVRSHPVSRSRAPGAQVNVLMSLDNRAVIPGRHGGQTGDLIRSILNGAVRYHLLDKDGVHLKLTRSARTVSHSQEVALLALWGHQCATPGCPHTRFLEFHHIIDWAVGGETNIDNLIPLCSGCHALVTAGRMVILIDDQEPGTLRFRLPGGVSFTSERRQPPIRNQAMAQGRDKYTFGGVPEGDAHLIPVWEHEDAFDDLPDTTDTG